MDTFAELMATERDRITNERAALVHDRETIDVAIDTLDREMNAIAAYEQAKRGKAPARTNGAAKRVRSGSKREEIIEFVTAYPKGLSRGELLGLMNIIKGDKSGEMSVSNALSALIKNNTLTRTVDGKKYVLAV